MGNKLKKIRKTAVNNAINNTDERNILIYASAEASRRANEIAVTMAENMMNSLALALEGVFREEYGFGDKRLYRLMQQLNERLPEHLEFGVPKREKIDKDTLYDLTELLLELGCDKSCKLGNYKHCKYYAIYENRNIPKYNEEENPKTCPYKIIPGEHSLSESQIEALRIMIRDRRKRLCKTL